MIGMKKLGMSCEHVSRLVSTSKDRPLSMGERLKVTMHLAICRHCTRFEEQQRLLKGAIEKDKRGDRARRAHSPRDHFAGLGEEG